MYLFRADYCYRIFWLLVSAADKMVHTVSLTEVLVHRPVFELTCFRTVTLTTALRALKVSFLTTHTLVW